MVEVVSLSGETVTARISDKAFLWGQYCAYTGSAMAGEARRVEKTTATTVAARIVNGIVGKSGLNESVNDV